MSLCRLSCCCAGKLPLPDKPCSVPWAASLIVGIALCRRKAGGAYLVRQINRNEVIALAPIPSQRIPYQSGFTHLPRPCYKNQKAWRLGKSLKQDMNLFTLIGFIEHSYYCE